MVSPLTAVPSCQGGASHETFRHAHLAPTGRLLVGNPSTCRANSFAFKSLTAPTILLLPCNAMLGSTVSSHENAISTHTNARTATAVHPMEPRSNEPLPRDAPGMHTPYPSVPNAPQLVPQQWKGYQKPLKAVTPLPTSINFLTHNIATQPPTSHILRRLDQGYDVVFLQELNKNPLLPHSFSMGANSRSELRMFPKAMNTGLGCFFHPGYAHSLSHCPSPTKKG